MTTTTMNPVYRAWWRAMMDLRPFVRYLAERLPRLAPWAVRTRVLTHVLVGNPLHVLAVVDAAAVWTFTGWPLRWMLAAIAVVFLLLEVFYRLSGGWLVGWREAWRFRRRWPADWAAVAAKTARVQAEVGTSKEPIASAVLRPVADHPKLSWWPSISWPVISWWVGPPPGRSLTSLDELTVILAANISRAADIAVDHERENDSHGRLVVSFRHVLAETSSPAWATSPAPTSVVELGELDAAVAAVEREVPVRPPLRLVQGEAQ